MNKVVAIIILFILISISVLKAPIVYAQDGYKSTYLLGKEERNEIETIQNYETISYNDIERMPVKVSELIRNLKMQRGYYIFDSKACGLKEDEVLLLIAAGEKATLGYDIGIIKEENMAGKAIFTVKETVPPKTERVLEAITYPYSIIKLNSNIVRLEIRSEEGEEFKILTPINKDSDEKKDDWIDLQGKENIESDKEWTVSFNKGLKERTLDSEDVFVTDLDGNRVKTRLALSQDRKSIKITPIKAYKVGANYYLFINTGKIEEAYGKNGHRMRFAIRAGTEE